MAFEATLDLLTLRRDGVDASHWPRLSCSQAQQAALAGSDLRLDAGREVLFQDQGQIRAFDDTHRLVFNRAGGLLELHEQGAIRFLTGAPAPSERLRILATGQVGLGTATPTQALDVVGTVKATAFQGNGSQLTEVRDTTKVAKAGDTMIGALTLTAAGTGLTVANNANVGGTLTVTGNVGIGTYSVYNPQGWSKVLEVLGTSHARFNVRSSGGVVTSVFSHDNWVGQRGVIGTDSGHPLTFATGYAHQMTIDTAGNVGIGTYSVYNPQGWSKVLEVLGTSHARFNVRSSGGVVTSVFSHDGWVGQRGVIGTDSGHPLTFATGYAHKMTIDTAGNVGIGVIFPSEKLHVIGGRIRLQKAFNSTACVDLRADGSAFDLESSGADLYINNNNRPVHIRNLQSGSSREWKEDIAEFSHEEATQVLKRLNPVTFRFKEDESRQRHLGFVAEEVPASVATADRKAFSPIAIISVLTKVVQEQREEISALQGDVALLKDRAGS